MRTWPDCLAEFQELIRCVSKPRQCWLNVRRRNKTGPGLSLERGRQRKNEQTRRKTRDFFHDASRMGTVLLRSVADWSRLRARALGETTCEGGFRVALSLRCRGPLYAPVGKGRAL